MIILKKSNLKQPKQTSLDRQNKKTKLIVVLCIIAISLIISVMFAFSSNSTIEGVLSHFTVSYETDQDSSTAAYTNGTISFGVHTTWSDGTCGPKYKTYEGTLTFTNSSEEEKILYFEYRVNGKGTAAINNTAVEGVGVFSSIIDPGETVQIKLNSYKSKDGTETAEIFNIFEASTNETQTITLSDNEFGTISLNGNMIDEETTINTDYETGITVSAVPNSGYSFIAWIDENNKILSTHPSDTLHLISNATVYAVFASTNDPYYRVGNTAFDNFQSASYAAQNGADKIMILIKSGVFPAGNYTIPNGVTFLIPFSDAYNCYTTNPLVIYNVYDAPSAYVTLTLEDGANIIVDEGAAISVSSQLSAYKQNADSKNSTPTGKHGRIHLTEGSSISINDGGCLYCYGYISGQGTVEALPGAEVWESLQILSWRGGTASTSMNDIFPFNQYYVQNIETKLLLHSGSSEHVFTAINALEREYDASAVFIGEGGLFTLENGYISKQYDGTRDRLIFDINGDLTLSSLTINDLPIIETLNTSALESLPITNNVTINVNSGKTTIGEALSFLPGVEIFVANDAELELLSGKKAILYDADNWGYYCGPKLKMSCIAYTTVNGATKIRTEDDLKDVLLDINGTLILNGSLYTTGTNEATETGANIISSAESGTIIFNADSPAELTETYQVTQSGSDITFVSIPITSAKLHNADGTYTLTTDAAGGDTYVYCPYCDVWGLDEDHAHTGTVIWENWDKTELMREDVAYGVVPEYTGTTPEKVSNDPRFNYIFHDWYQTRTEVSGEVTKYTAEFKAFSTDPAQTNNALKFTTAALTLENDITVNFKINKNAVDNAGFNLLYTIFTVNNEAKIVTGYEKDGYYVFDCKGVFPKYLNNRIFATLYAEKDGTLYTATTSYRAATYCYSLFNNPGTDAPELLKKLAVDTLLYGEAAQLHFNYRTDALCTSKLTAEHMAYASTSTGELVNRLSIEKTIETASASWKAATLFLNNSIDFRFQFSHTNGTEGLYAIMTDTVTGRTWRVSSFESAKDSNTGNVIADNYWVFFKGLNASQMNNEVKVVIYNADNEQISRTLHYSIESYVKYTVENSTNEKLLNLVECIIKYGNSAKAYVNRNN